MLGRMNLKRIVFIYYGWGWISDVGQEEVIAERKQSEKGKYANYVIQSSHIYIFHMVILVKS